MLSKFKIIFPVILLVFISSCFTPISRIVNNPEKYKGKKVKVKGKVINSIHLDDLDLFTLKGEKHTIEVVTEGFLPVINDFVIVKGRIDNKFYYQRDTLVVIKEKVKKAEILAKEKNLDYKYINKKMK